MTPVTSSYRTEAKSGVFQHIVPWDCGSCSSYGLSKNILCQMDGIDYVVLLVKSCCVVCVCICVCDTQVAKADLSVSLTLSDRGRASVKAAASHHINSPKNVLIQSILYFMLPRAMEKELLPVQSSEWSAGPEAITVFKQRRVASGGGANGGRDHTRNQAPLF